MKIYNYISMLFLAGAAIVASCSQNEELTGETPDSLQGFQISVSDEGFMDESGKTRATENGYTTLIRRRWILLKHTSTIGK